MASRQEETGRAEGAARKAAEGPRDVNKEREFETTTKVETEQPRAGVLGALSPGSILRTVQEAVTGKSPDTTTHETAAGGDYAGKGQEIADKMREYKDSTANKAGAAKDTAAQKAYETKDAAAQKTGEYTDTAAQKAKEAKDTAAQKAGETTESTKSKAAQKAREAKDTTAEKAGEYGDYASQKAREAKDTTTQKAGEYKDAAAQKAIEAKDTTFQKAGEYKDAAAQKAAEAKDAAAEKAKQSKDETVDKAGETKDYTGSKMTELKDSAADAGRRAMDFLTGKKEEVEEKTAESGEEAKIKYEENARRKMEEMKVGDEEDKDEEGRKAGGLMEHKSEVGSDRGTAGESNIMGAIGSMTRAIKEKLVGPKDTTVEQTRERREQEDEGRSGVVDVEKTRPGEVASKLKEADQMAGQAFNDVGRMGDETVERVERPGKM